MDARLSLVTLGVADLGRAVRFYDDLLRGRTVLVNFMYTRCDGT